MRRVKSERGAALVEAAITIPILLLISVGIFEFGRAYQTWQVMTNAAREGARIAILTGTTDLQIKERVRDYMVSGGLADATVDDVAVERSVTLTTDTASRVTINYPFDFMVLNPVVRLVVPDSNTGAPITMHSVALMRNES